MRPAARRGVTLLELVVTLALVALLVALVGPRLAAVPEPTREGIDDAVSQARAAAIRRGEGVTLRVARNGEWAVTRASAPLEEPVMSAALPDPPRAELALHLSPLGACLPDDAGPLEVAWDPIQCRPAREAPRP